MNHTFVKYIVHIVDHVILSFHRFESDMQIHHIFVFHLEQIFHLKNLFALPLLLSHIDFVVDLLYQHQNEVVLMVQDSHYFLMDLYWELYVFELALKFNHYYLIF